MAALLRTRSRFFSSAPPPSPIATAKGSRSAAVDDGILSEFLEKSLKIPDLTLPESHFSARIPCRIPAEIDLSSLRSRDEDSVLRLLESVVDLGAFQIVGHGISDEWTIDGWDQIFGIPADRKRQISRNFGTRNGTREDFLWRGTEKESVRTLFEEIGADRLRMFRETMESMSVKLGGIAEDVGQVLSEHFNSRKIKIPETEPVLCLHKYSQEKLGEGSLSIDMQQDEHYFSQSLSLHLCCEDLQFRVRSQKGSVSFNVVAGDIVITVGKQLQEWSQRDLEFVVGEPMFEPGVDPDPSFTIEFMCTPPSLNLKLNHETKTISLIDQMLIALVTVFLYKLLTYISSKISLP